jgi:ABC-2 type transport system ATP-binding protein
VPEVIELRGVGKRYRQLEEHERSLRSVPQRLRPGDRELWALRDVDLTVGEGEVVGVLGHNGAGKTTLLRLLAGITSPTEGRVRVAGRIAPLISLGVGFHQEMSGRENVLVNGMLLGLTAREVSQRFDSIVEFAELREVIDTPVKFYSSGMTMRLGFAVVIHVDPSILLVDEILAVGDAAFQLKCLERLRELQRQGAAIVMVSHAMHQIRQLCPRAVLIRHGRVVYDGEVERAIALHYRAISAAPAGGSVPGAVEVLERELIGAAGEHHHANYDELLELRLRVRLQRTVEAAQIEFAVKTDNGLLVMAQSAPLPSEPRLDAGAELLVRVAFRARLGGGTYLLSARLIDSAKQDLGGCEDLILFVAGRPGSMGAVDLRASMRVDGVERADRRLTLLG